MGTTVISQHGKTFSFDGPDHVAEALSTAIPYAFAEKGGVVIDGLAPDMIDHAPHTPGREDMAVWVSPSASVHFVYEPDSDVEGYTQAFRDMKHSIDKLGRIHFSD